MPDIATILITGICYLAQPDATTIRVVMPAASDARATLNKGGGGKIVGIPPHYAYVLFDLDLLDPSDHANLRIVNFQFHALSETGAPTEYGLLILSGELLEVQQAGITDVPPLTFGTDTAPSPPSNDQRMSLASFAVMSSICGDCKLDKKVFDPSPSRVNARLDLTFGKMSAAFVDQDTVWKFPTQAGRPLAQESAWDLTLDSVTPRLTITFKNIDATMRPAGSTTHLSFVPAKGKKVMLFIGNAPAVDALSLLGHREDDTVDVHFERYYDLVKGTPGNPPPIPTKSVRNPHGSNCPPLLIGIN